MHTTQEWWNRIKSSDTELIGWLQDQYRGEVTAAARIRKYVSEKANTEIFKTVLKVIATQEETHAHWVGELLRVRGVTPEEPNTESRYWKETLEVATSFEDATAVAAHAEGMRLERIRTIAGDESAPADVRAVFAKILPEEEFHEKAFSKMSTLEAMERTLDAHKRGLAAIGLVLPSEI